MDGMSSFTENKCTILYDTPLRTSYRSSKHWMMQVALVLIPRGLHTDPIYSLQLFKVPYTISPRLNDNPQYHINTVLTSLTRNASTKIHEIRDEVQHGFETFLPIAAGNGG